jgi:hypothetical protein
MRPTKIYNPDNAMMQQSEGMWQRYLALVLQKLAPEGVAITKQDVEYFAETDKHVVLIMGGVDSFILKMVTPAEAKRLAAYDAGMCGSA